MTSSPESIRLSEDATPSDALHFRGHLGGAVAGLLLPMDAEAAVSGLFTGPQWMLQMAKAESLISAIEQWQQAPWNLAPDPLSWNAPDLVDGCEAVVCAPALAPVGTRLRLPWSALHIAPPSWLQAPHVAWPCMAAEVCIDHLHGDELHGLSAGSLLWLTPSFNTVWPIALRDPLRRLPHCRGEWQRVHTPQGAIALDPLGSHQNMTNFPYAASQEAADQADVVLADPLSVPLEQWLGWSPPPARSVALPLNAESLAVKVHQGGTVHASGELLALGNGHALKVNVTASQAFNSASRTH